MNMHHVSPGKVSHTTNVDSNVPWERAHLLNQGDLITGKRDNPLHLQMGSSEIYIDSLWQGGAHMCQSVYVEVRGQPGCQSSPSTLGPLVCPLLHAIGQLALSFQEFCLQLSSLRVRITETPVHPVLHGFQGSKVRCLCLYGK